MQRCHVGGVFVPSHNKSIFFSHCWLDQISAIGKERCNELSTYFVCVAIKHFLPFLCLFFSCSVPNSNSERLSFGGMGYGQPNIFIYEVTQRDSDNVIFQTDTLALLCSSIVMGKTVMDGQTKMQWATVTNDARSKLIFGRKDDVTGIRSNDSVLYIHQPRFGCFQILEFCPFPLFYLNTDSGAWSWDLGIGSGYALPEYPVSDLDTFKIRYAFVDTLTMKVLQGELLCHHAAAVSSSKYGISLADYYLNGEHGMIKAIFQPVNKKTFDFRLIYVTDHPDTIEFSKDVISYYSDFIKRRADFNYFNDMLQ
jgi:hypothetical protein